MILLEHQARFIESNFLHTAIVGGFRSGKSEAGVIKTVLKKLAYPNIDVAYYLPTYGLIKDIAYPKFSKFLTEHKIPYTLNKSDHEIATPFGRIIMRSMDNPDTIIGYEVGYSIIDEADILSVKHMEDVFIKVLARLSMPLPDGLPNSLDFVSTPEGFKFLYNFFVKKEHPKKLLIKASTRNNPFISQSYIESLELSYTTKQLEAYLEGDFVNFENDNVYNNFDRKINNTTKEYKDHEVLHIGMDFNITKMNAVVHIINDGILYAVAEIVNAYDTVQMCEIIKDRFNTNQIVIYPDASGGSRKTSSSDTDIQILKKYGFKVVVDNTNPQVKDRITTMNISFKNSKSEIKYFINVANCPTYTEALEQLVYKNGIPDKTSGVDHITDAGGYCCYHQFSINKKSFQTRFVS